MEKSNQNIIQNIASMSTANLSPADNLFIMYFLLLQCVSFTKKVDQRDRLWGKHECMPLKSIQIS